MVYNVYIWVNKIINSCKTIDQINNAENLITNFSNLYSRHVDLIRKLNQIHYIKSKTIYKNIMVG